jgi:hypothetical protein
MKFPSFVKEEFDAFLECGILAHGFLRLRCADCAHEKLVAFSCKRRGFCPSCGARRMAETAAYLVDHVIPRVPVRQWVLSFPIPLRLLFATDPELLAPVLRIVHRVIPDRHRAAGSCAAHQRKKLESQGQGLALLGAPKTQYCTATSRALPSPMNGLHSTGPGGWCSP